MGMAMIGVFNHHSNGRLGRHNNSSRTHRILRSNVFNPNHDLHHHHPVSHRRNTTSYLGSAGSSSFGSTVRRIYDLGLDLPITSSSSSSSVRMVTSLPDDFFYDWLEGRLDLDGDLQLIDQSLEKSPRSDDDSVPLIVRVAQSIEEFSGGSESTVILLDSGSDVSLLP